MLTQFSSLHVGFPHEHKGPLTMVARNSDITINISNCVFHCHGVPDDLPPWFGKGVKGKGEGKGDGFDSDGSAEEASRRGPRSDANVSCVAYSVSEAPGEGKGKGSDSKGSAEEAPASVSEAPGKGNGKGKGCDSDRRDVGREEIPEVVPKAPPPVYCRSF